MARIRVVRELIYEGDEDWVRSTLAKNAIKETQELGNNCRIHSKIKSSEPLGSLIVKQQGEQDVQV